MSFNISTPVNKSRVQHRCFNEHNIPVGCKCYKQSGVIDGEWYNYYTCEFCTKVLEILTNRGLLGEELSTSSMYDQLDHYFNSSLCSVDINLIDRKVTIETDEEITMSFEEFYIKIRTQEV